MNNVDIQNIIKSLEWINLEVILINSRIENIKKALADLMIVANGYYEEDQFDLPYVECDIKAVDNFSFGDNNWANEITPTLNSPSSSMEIDENGDGVSMTLVRDRDGRPATEVRYRYESGKGIVAGEIKDYTYPDKTSGPTRDKTTDFIISTLQGEE